MKNRTSNFVIKVLAKRNKSHFNILPCYYLKYIYLYIYVYFVTFGGFYL